MRLRSDEASWSEFVDLYAPLLYRWNVSAGLQPADAEEVVQEVLIVVHRRIGDFDRGRPGAFRAWLRAITLNKIREIRRLRRRDAAWTADGGAPELLPDHGADFAWAERYAEDLFRRACELVRPLVTEATWKMFMAAYVEGSPVPAIARRFGVTKNAVYVAQCRCMAKVRQILGRYLDDSLQAPIAGDYPAASLDDADV